MRTNEERVAALHERVRQLEYRRQLNITRIVSAAAVAAGLALIVLLGFIIPGAVENVPAFYEEQGMTASILSSNSALGFIVIGILAFILGVLVTILCYRLKRQLGDQGKNNN